MSEPRQLPLTFEHPPSHAVEDFLVADCNCEAVRWLDRWPNWPSPALVVHGRGGCGKTHLAQIFACRTGALLVSHQELARDALVQSAVLSACSAACIVDDADQAVAAGLEEPLLHLHNSLAEQHRRLLLTAETPAVRWPMALADLRSRLLASASVGIGAPDDALMAGLLVKLFADRQLRVDDEVILYALPRIERSFDAARRLVADLDAATVDRRPSISVVRKLLRPQSE